MAVLNRARAPRVPKERLCPTRPSTPGFYALVTRRTGPSTGVMLRSKRTRRRPHQPGGAAHPPSSWGWSALVDRPEDVDDRRVPGHWEGDLIIGNL